MAERKLVRPTKFVGAFVSAVVLGWAGTSAIADSPNDITPAEAGEATYVISNIEVVFPYKDDQTKPDENRAGILYEQTWTSETYPGPADCLFEVFDKSGEPVGAVVTEVRSQLAHQTADQWGYPIEVSGVPVSATVTCAAAVKPAPESVYTFSDSEVATSADGDLELTTTVGWATSEPPSFMDCDATFTLADGSQSSERWTLSVGPGKLALGLDSRFKGATFEELKCVPFTTDEASIVAS